MDWITIAMLVVAGMFGLSFVDVGSIWAKLGLSRQPDPVSDLADAIRALHSVINYCLAHARVFEIAHRNTLLLYGFDKDPLIGVEIDEARHLGLSKGSEGWTPTS